ncbi:L-proline trans-4-hydroxylase-like [Sycon ciliatum]|uniref:L-proline trans-4-hydroxylase-like n=1 Tax=Sycon ciliatum TaxID=27933 RepID=UPI0031F61327
MLSAEEVQQYHADGYLIKRQFFSREESQRLLEKSRSDKVLQESAIRRDDKDGRTTKLTVWNHPIDDLYGMFSRNKRLVTAVEQLMGEPVYHYHSKIMLKEPRVGGAWEWHQDYGYWYKNGCLYPLMLSAMIAIDRATTDNGCLQVLKGSHHVGRVNHGVTGGQVGADMQRVDAAVSRHELIHCELEQGDVLFLHCNTLHKSAANLSDNPRWSYIIAYNAVRNDPLWEHHHASYTPLKTVDGNAIMQWKEDTGSSDHQALIFNTDKDSGDRTED